MKLSPPLVLSISLISCWPSLAADEDQRFVEFQSLGQIETFDLTTVQMIQPGRFTIISTAIDDADVMKLELKVLDTLRTYCKRSEGHYSPPNELFVLGPPDMPIKTIDVKTYSTQSKYIFWYYPYERLAIHTNDGVVIQKEAAFYCRDESPKDAAADMQQRSSIMNGHRKKQLFDCKRGLSGLFWDVNDDPAEVTTSFVTPQTYGDLIYRGICLRVTHEEPYTP